MVRVLRLLLVLALAALPVAAQARDITPAEEASLSAAIATFNTAITTNDFDTIVKVIPPQVVTYIATGAGMTDEQLVAEMIKQLTAAMASIKIESFSMDVASAEHRELGDGTPYLLIPTSTLLDAGTAGKISASSPTLALMKDGTWYLMRIADDSQASLLRGAFPEFEGVEFPKGTMEKVTQ